MSYVLVTVYVYSLAISKKGVKTSLLTWPFVIDGQLKKRITPYYNGTELITLLDGLRDSFSILHTIVA